MAKIRLQINQKSAVEAYLLSSIEEFSKLSKNEHIILNKSGFSFQLNGALRAGLLLNQGSNEFCKMLDSAFNSYTTSENITVYRVCNYKEMLRYIENNKYFDLGYMSTSKSTQPILRFFENPKIGYSPAFLTISIPAGSNILILDYIEDLDNTTYEEEILIKRNSMFEIISRDEIESKEIEEHIGAEICDMYNKITRIELKFLTYLS